MEHCEEELGPIEHCKVEVQPVEHGVNGYCAADENEAWGFGDAVLMPHCKNCHTRCNVLTN